MRPYTRHERAIIFKHLFHYQPKLKPAATILWLLPFVGFLGGYIIAYLILHKTDFPTPNIMGKSVSDAVDILSSNRLGLRLLSKEVNSTLKEGTIVKQIPSPSQKIRPNQHVFAVVTTKQQQVLVPDFFGKKNKEVVGKINQLGLEAKIVYVHSPYTNDVCIAQHPAAGQPLPKKKFLVYFSAGKPTEVVVPSLQGQAFKDIEKGLGSSNVRVEIIHTKSVGPDHRCDECIVVDQYPKAGTFIDSAQGIQLQLHLKPQD